MRFSTVKSRMALATDVQVSEDTLAVELAERFNITLVGFLRPNTMNVYANPNRILEEM